DVSDDDMKQIAGSPAPKPYVIMIDASTKEVLGIYRNWEKEDERETEIDRMIEFPFIPWRGLPIGLFQLIGSLSIAATGSLRALLDSAHFSNAATLAKLKGTGGRLGGQTTRLNITQITEIDTPPNVDDIRKVMMP